MPTIRVAYTAAVNPPTLSPSEPRLTLPQLWSCMELKIRAAQDFVGGAILSTDIVSESREPIYPGSVSDTAAAGDTVPVTVREVVFSEGKRRVRETVKAHEPMKVVFYQEDGSVITNLISEGPMGGEDAGDWWLTYFFEWRVDGDVPAEDMETRRQKNRKLAKVAVDETILACRRFVSEGRVK